MSHDLKRSGHVRPLSRPSPGQAAALGGASIVAAAIAIGIAQIELSGQSQPHIWSNSWLLVALFLAFAGIAIAVVFFVAAMFARPSEERVKGLASGTGNVHSEIRSGTFYGPVVQGRDVDYGSPPARSPSPPDGPDTKPAR